MKSHTSLQIALNVLLFMGLAQSAQARPIPIMPPNNLHVFDRVSRIQDIDETEFNRVIDGITAIWAPLAKIHGAELQVVKEWTNSTVNAFAEQHGKIWEVHFFGGLARRPEVTSDGFALVVCHELGHHFAGFPFVGGGSPWAANEGESDYFATHACLRHALHNMAQARVSRQFRSGVPPVVKAPCDTAWKNPLDQDLCYRAANAGLSLSTLFAGGGKGVAFDTPDRTVVPRTNNAHPAAQCRLDTYFSAALCSTKTFDLNVIPGKGNPAGQASAEAEKHAAMYSCTRSNKESMGVRPECWFKPQLSAPPRLARH